MSAVNTAEAATTSTLHRELESIVGAKHVIGSKPELRKKDRRNKSRKDQPQRRAAASSLMDCAIEGVMPAAVVSPGTENEVAAILDLATKKDYIVVPAGGLTKQGIGAIAERVDIVLKLDRFNSVLHYDAGDLTLGVGAGMTIAEVQNILSANAQFLPLDPMLPARATIGGVLAANSSGPLRSGFGSVRDYCIGVSFVTGDCKIAKGGGRVVKNVAGYDLMKLMIGSMGTLGVITSANFKVFPRPQHTCTFVCECNSLAEAITLRDRIIASPLSPMCLEIISPRAQEYLSGPADIRDPDHYAPLAGLKQLTTWNVIVRAGGSNGVLHRYRSELGNASTRELRDADEKRLWQWISDFEDLIMARHRNAMIVNVSVSLSGVRQAYEAADQSAVEHNLLNASVGRAASGALLFAFMPMGVDPPAAMQFANVASALRGRLPKGASAVVVRCPRESKERFDVWGSTTNDMEMMRGIRAAMDPHKTLNRGRFIV